MGLTLEKGISETETKELTVEEWYKKLIEAIQEDLFSQEELNDLFNDCWTFLVLWTNNHKTATEIQNAIVKSYFFSMIEAKERKKNKQKVLLDSALDTLEDKLGNTDDISAVEMSQIFKNLKA